jgi:hypothetical protein
MTERHNGPEEFAGTLALHSTNLTEIPRQRRSGRLSVSLPILIMGSNSDGRVFSEHTHTVVVSLHGAGIVSRHRLIAEQELLLRSEQLKREAEIRVVGEIGQQGNLYTYGVAFTDEKLDFWKMEFPEAPAWQERPEALALRCSGCKHVIQLSNGEYEYDVCAIHGGLPRFCDHCGLLTVWNRSYEVMPLPPTDTYCGENVEVTAGSVAVAESEFPGDSQTKDQVVSLADAMDGTERRSRVRAKVNFSACVRSQEFGDDIVRCIDMSRGGVSFRSQNAYQKNMEVRLAVPFSPDAREAPAIFVKGRIANIKRLADEGVFRCGVEFLRE